LPRSLFRLLLVVTCSFFWLGCDASSFTTPSSSGQHTPAAGSGGSTGRACTKTLSKAPTCGVLWGSDAQGASVAGLEQATGRRLDIVYYFEGVDSGALPTAQQRSMVAAGHTLHINLEARQFAVAGHPEVRWSQIAAGDFDAQLRRSAAALAALKSPLFLTFDHEADVPAKPQARGTPAQFVAAWRHLHQLFAAASASNVIWTWVVTGYPPNDARAAALYPGDDVVDWISWDPYDQRGCQSGGVGTRPTQTFAEVAAPFYRWLETSGVKAGISLDKPYLISETASAYDPKDPAASAAFYRSIPAGLKQLPRIRAVTLWDESTGKCNYKILGDAAAESALSEALRATGQPPA
jgi:hypothetical protein